MFNQIWNQIWNFATSPSTPEQRPDAAEDEQRAGRVEDEQPVGGVEDEQPVGGVEDEQRIGGADKEQLQSETSKFILHQATSRGATQTVKSLLSDVRCEVDTADDKGRTALYLACSKGFHSIAELLLDHGADMGAVCRTSPGLETALHLAAESGSEATADLLLSRGADVDAADRHGESALHRACGIGNPEVAEVLLSHGACVTSTSSSERYAGYTALHFAAWSGLEDTVQLLLDRKADANAAASDGVTPLHLACKFWFPKVAERLLRSHARVNVALEEAREGVAKGSTPLHLAALEKNFEKAELIQELLQLLFDWGADVNATDAMGRTPLSIVLQWWNSDERKETVYKAFARQLVKLISRGRPLNGVNRQALEPLSDYVENCKDEIERMRNRQTGNSRITVFDLLTTSLRRMAYYAENQSIADYLDSGNFEIQFPIYASEIRKKFRQGQERSDLQQKSDAVLFRFREIPDESLRIINRYLTNEDLLNVVKAE